MSALEEWVRPMLLSRRAALARSTSELDPRAARELAEIDAALVRLQMGSYGHCEACNGQIGRQRLRARPEVRQCVECESGSPPGGRPTG